jgi:exopolysaccharide biosynthesis WecB/TagA/CpsF family protein
VLVIGPRTDAKSTALIRAARSGRPLVLAESVPARRWRRDPELGAILNSFGLVTPDGQPVRWALNLLHSAGLPERVYGPTLMRRLCEAAAREDVSVYFYGSRPEVLMRMIERLSASLPGLNIAGSAAPPFRPLSAAEDRAQINQIIASNAQLVFVGLGCPRQERWAHAHRLELNRPLVSARRSTHGGTFVRRRHGCRRGLGGCSTADGTTPPVATLRQAHSHFCRACNANCAQRLAAPTLSTGGLKETAVTHTINGQARLARARDGGGDIGHTRSASEDARLLGAWR